jgi:hypothetical protein
MPVRHNQRTLCNCFMAMPQLKASVAPVAARHPSTAFGCKPAASIDPAPRPLHPPRPPPLPATWAATWAPTVSRLQQDRQQFSLQNPTHRLEVPPCSPLPWSGGCLGAGWPGVCVLWAAAFGPWRAAARSAPSHIRGRTDAGSPVGATGAVERRGCPAWPVAGEG